MINGTSALLLAAGVLGGIMNAMAGGASLVTFPAMLVAGLPPITANASNALGVSSSNAVAAFADRHLIPREGREFWPAIVSAVIGGAIGGLLLLVTTEAQFTKLVPALIGFGTLVFAYGKTVQAKARSLFGAAASTPAAFATALLPTTIYGGYFGAGLGVMLMATITAATPLELRAANAFKNLLGILTNSIAIVIFIWNGIIAWPQTLTLMAGCICGGLIGARLIAIIPAATMRRIIIAAGIAMTAIYAWKYWF